jgi:hypothetical protein
VLLGATPVSTRLPTPSAPAPGAVLPSMTFEQQLAFFFTKRPRKITHGTFHSTLILIRDDIKCCAPRGSNQLAFPRAMCHMVALDLLAKLHSGSDAKGQVGSRFIAFTDFALQHGNFGSDLGTKIWEFRNALHHSYRLPTTWKPPGAPSNVSRRFRLLEDRRVRELTWDTADETFINLFRLQKEIAVGIKRFREHVAAYTAPTDQHKFSSMFEKYGWLYVGT